MRLDDDSYRRVSTCMPASAPRLAPRQGSSHGQKRRMMVEERLNPLTKLKELRMKSSLDTGSRQPDKAAVETDDWGRRDVSDGAS